LRVTKWQFCLDVSCGDGGTQGRSRRITIQPVWTGRFIGNGCVRPQQAGTSVIWWFISVMCKLRGLAASAGSKQPAQAFKRVAGLRCKVAGFDSAL